MINGMIVIKAKLPWLTDGEATPKHTTGKSTLHNRRAHGDDDDDNETQSRKANLEQWGNHDDAAADDV